MSKKPEGKPKLSYLYTSMMNEVARVREYGLGKHGSLDGWKTTTIKESCEAAERHTRALMDGEVIDQESGLQHAAHAICNLMFEIERGFKYPNSNELNKNIETYKKSIAGFDKIQDSIKYTKTGKIRKEFKNKKDYDKSIAGQEIKEFDRIQNNIKKENKK